MAAVILRFCTASIAVSVKIDYTWTAIDTIRAPLIWDFTTKIALRRGTYWKPTAFCARFDKHVFVPVLWMRLILQKSVSVDFIRTIPTRMSWKDQCYALNSSSRVVPPCTLIHLMWSPLGTECAEVGRIYLLQFFGSKSSKYQYVPSITAFHETSFLSKERMKA